MDDVGAAPGFCTSMSGVRGEVSEPAPALTVPRPVPADLDITQVVPAWPTDILVIDDNAANLRAIEAALHDLGANLVSVQSGTEGLRRLLERDFALILLDVQMPEMDGYETARLIRERDRSRHTPIIFVTAFEREEREVLAGYRLGAVDFLYKPVVPEILRTKVQVFVTLHQRTVEVAAQAKLLAQAEALEMQRRLTSERQAWEAAALRRQIEVDRRAAEEIARKATELAGTVTALEKTERELTALNQRLAASDQRKVEFLAILSHELRNSLAPMVNSLEMLRERQGQTDASAYKAHDAIDRQVEHLRRLVDDLLDLSRIDSGKVELRREPIQLSGLVADAATMAGPLFAARRQSLTIRQPEEPIWLLADPTRILQVLSNLLGNAARYSRCASTTQLHVELDGPEVVIRVIDQGDGIEPSLLPHVFDGFVQAKSGGGGLGIGLTVARMLVDRHGGTLTAISAGAGLGSTFEIRLPLAQIEEAAPLEGDETSPMRCRRDSARPPPALVEGPLHVVLIEDNDDIRETTQVLLEMSGHRVEVAADGPSGVDLVLKSKPQVALVDIGLPGFDGHEVASRIRKSLGKDVLRLVAMTGFGQASDRQRALDSGFDDHLTKPAAAAQLRHALRPVAS